jgi:lipoprotein-releasing system ATP-binding protein
MSELWLEAEGLHKSYQGPHGVVRVLAGVDVRLGEGQSCAITGASGSGKSTLLNLLGRLDRPDAGSIVWGGEDVVALSDGRLSRMRNLQVGFVFQSHHLLGDFSALENVMLPALAAGNRDGETRRRAGALLEEVGLGARAGHRPGELSGGEQQRIAVARALINRPKLILADEPGGNLDGARADQLHDLLLRLVETERAALLVVTHDPRLAERADHWFELRDGCLHGRGPESGGPN